jgi:hypothetical protein
VHALWELDAPVVLVGPHHDQRSFGLLFGLLPLVTTSPAATFRIVRNVAVLHQIFLVNVSYRLEVTLGRLKLETVTLLQRYLEMFFVLRFRRERLALGQRLVEQSSRDELRVFLMGDGCRILRGQADIYVFIMRGC